MKKAIPFIALLLCAFLLLGGCVQRIREDAVKDELPDLFPNVGIGQEMEITLYFRLKNEPVLVPVKRLVNVRANEDAAEVVVRELISGPDAVFGDQDAVLPEDTAVVDFKRENGNTVFVTLNASVLQANRYAGTREEQSLAQRLAVYALANSLCSLNHVSGVQIMVDVSGNGQGKRVSPFQFGFSKEEMSSEFLGPVGMTDSVVLTRTRLVELAFSHLVEGDFVLADRLFAEMETGGLQKPNYAAFETEMLSLGTIDSYEVIGTKVINAQINGEAEVEFTWTSRTDGIPRAVHTTLQLIPEGELYKLGYYSLTDAMRASLIG